MDGTLVEFDVDWKGFQKEKGDRNLMECLDILEKYEMRNIDNIKLNRKMIDKINGLKTKKLAIFSRNTRKLVEEALKRIGIKFDVVITINDIKKPKPDPEGLEKIINKLNVKKEKTLYIGDRNIDRIAGNKIGIKTSLVNKI